MICWLERAEQASAVCVTGVVTSGLWPPPDNYRDGAAWRPECP